MDRPNANFDFPYTGRPTTVSDLIGQCNEAVKVMGTNNDHKLLMVNCALAMRQLVDHNHELSQELEIIKAKLATYETVQ